MQLHTLLPTPHLIQLDYLIASDVLITLVARTYRPEATCPGCGRTATRVQSRYTRALADLPWHGIPVWLQLRFLRFFCDRPGYSTAIFTARLLALVDHPPCRRAPGFSGEQPAGSPPPDEERDNNGGEDRQRFSSGAVRSEGGTMRSGPLCTGALVILALLAGLPARAFVAIGQVVNGVQQHPRWPNRLLPISFTLNDRPLELLPDIDKNSTPAAAIRAAMQSWAAGPVGFTLDGTNPALTAARWGERDHLRRYPGQPGVRRRAREPDADLGRAGGPRAAHR
jgi:transposase IS204/IS1001/IS1096/IS1165 family protein